jgi:hypothetical protein
MGHSSINVTMDTYGHLMDTVNRAAADRLGEQILDGSWKGNGSKMVAGTEKGPASSASPLNFLEAATRLELVNNGFAVRKTMFSWSFTECYRNL